MKKKKKRNIQKSDNLNHTSIRKEQKAEELANKKQIQDEKTKAKAEAKALDRARMAELKNEKEELYIIRKNTSLKVARIMLWVILIFIFIKGVIVCIRPDPTAEVNKTISTFKEEYSGYQEQDNEILSFAQNFAVQYLTYESSGELDYTERLRKYCADAIVLAGYKFPIGTSAKVIYANAYKKEAYSSTQTDVWVLLTVEYKSKQSNDKEIITEVTSLDTTILKIPVCMKNNRYIVEDIPIFVNDTMKLSDYQVEIHKGKECTTDTTDAIKGALSNFYKAYYEQSQSVINYFLAPSADTTKFMGLGGRVTFNRINTIRTYYKNENTTTEFIVILSLSVTDKNGVTVNQNFNLKVIYKDNQYYIVEMNARNSNLNMEEK